jgi:acyl-[acyl-carrier-protein] desaturase
LEPVAERLLDRHLAMAKEWLPHEYVPWRLGRDFDTEPWTPDQPRPTGVARAAFEVNLLTEDNLPSYHHQLLATYLHMMFYRDIVAAALQAAPRPRSRRAPRR